MYRTIVLAIILTLGLFACKEDSKAKVSTDQSTTNTDIPVHTPTEDGGYKISPTDKEYDMASPLNQTVAGPGTIQTMRGQAMSILEDRIKRMPEVPAIIDLGTFFYEFIVKGANVSEVGTLDNKWIDFGGDNTYTYGYNREVYGGGKFHYNSNDAVLLLVDNNDQIKPQEFDAKHAGSAMVLVGRPTYKDNNMQMKLLKIDIK